MSYVNLHKVCIEDLGLSEQVFENAESFASSNDVDIEDILCSWGTVKESILYKAIAEDASLDYCSSENVPVRLDDTDLFDNMLQYHVIPKKEHNGYALISYQTEIDDAISDFSTLLNSTTYAEIADKSVVLNALKSIFRDRMTVERCEQLQSLANTSILGDSEQSASTDTANAASGDESNRIVNLLSALCEYAVNTDASDIHIDPSEKSSIIRFRHDGDLHVIGQYGHDDSVQLVTRIKVLSHMKLEERRLPQDGGFIYKNEYYDVEFRVSVIPTIFGESCVLRLIDKGGKQYDLETLGMSALDKGNYLKMLKFPYGLILVTGPTGSGKTTTLYTTLQMLVDPKVNIMTVEDPVERTIAGTKQIQINPAIGLDFASVLRSILRHDPDIILVGEIRDKETAEIAVQAAITGHLVLATLHTNDAVSAIARLRDMGIESYMINAALIGVFAQRLIKRLCPKCKKECFMSDSDAHMLDLPNDTVTYECSGCSECGDIGYNGRIAVYESLLMSTNMRDAIYADKGIDTLRGIAKDSGMVSLKDNCRRLVQDGVVSAKDAVRIVYENV